MSTRSRRPRGQHTDWRSRATDDHPEGHRHPPEGHRHHPRAGTPISTSCADRDPVDRCLLGPGPPGAEPGRHDAGPGRLRRRRLVHRRSGARRNRASRDRGARGLQEGPAIFYRLGALRNGDAINILRTDGTTARFVADNVVRYPKHAFPTQAVFGPAPDPVLRLITCGGRFDRTRRSYVDNVIVTAHLATP